MTEMANRLGLIYKIVCNDLNITDTYVGSCQAFRARKCKHKSICNNPNSKAYNLNVYQFIRANGGWDNWSMIQIENVLFLQKRELLTRERYYIETLRSTLNKQMPGRTPQEYREANYEKNKTEINEKQKELITCVCGKSLTKGVISRHKKSRRHRNYISPQIVISEISRTEISIL